MRFSLRETILVPTGQCPGIKREHGRADLDGARSVTVPATVSGESSPKKATGQPGRLDDRQRPASQETCQYLVTQPPDGESGGAALPLVVTAVIAMRMSARGSFQRGLHSHPKQRRVFEPGTDRRRACHTRGGSPIADARQARAIAISHCSSRRV